MIIEFEKGLETKALTVQKLLKSVYGVDTDIKESSFDEIFQFRDFLNGYEIQTDVVYKDTIFLTSKDIFMPNATSKEDDWVFGCTFSDDKQFLISTARLTTDDQFIFVVLHELGHAYVQNQEHFEDYIMVNPETNHKMSLGSHCLDQKCLMSEFISLEDLKNHIRNNYPGYFCEKCKPVTLYPEYCYGDFRDRFDTLPEEGDVVTSPQFAFGSKHSWPPPESIAIHGVSDKTPLCNLDAYDPTRALANFVIESVIKQNNSIFNLRITARRLSPNNEYDPKGELITLYSDFPISWLRKVDEMQKMFVKRSV